MPDNSFGHAPGPGSRRSLSAQGQFLNTFAGIGFWLAISLLALGGYGIAQQFSNPLQAQAADLPFFALLIATAVTLLYCLLHSVRRPKHRIAIQPAATSWRGKTSGIARSVVRSAEDQEVIPPHGRYVDRVFVRVPR